MEITLIILLLSLILLVIITLFLIVTFDLSVDFYYKHYLLIDIIETKRKVCLYYIGSGIPECYVSHGDLIYADLLLNVNNQIVVKTVLYTFTYNNEKAFFKDWSFCK